MRKRSSIWAGAAIALACCWTPLAAQEIGLSSIGVRLPVPSGYLVQEQITLSDPKTRSRCQLGTTGTTLPGTASGDRLQAFAEVVLQGSARLMGNQVLAKEDLELSGQRAVLVETAGKVQLGSVATAVYQLNVLVLVVEQLVMLSCAGPDGDRVALRQEFMQIARSLRFE